VYLTTTNKSWFANVGKIHSHPLTIHLPFVTWTRYVHLQAQTSKQLQSFQLPLGDEFWSMIVRELTKCALIFLYSAHKRAHLCMKVAIAEFYTVSWK